MHASSSDSPSSQPSAGRKPPTISIGVPVYNGEKYLEATLKCLLAQTYGDFELIISDNASVDGTEAICRRFADSDPRIRYHRAKVNGGAAWNFNRVVDLAQGTYFKWAASDDLISPDFLEATLADLRSDPGLLISYGITVLIDADGAEKEVRPDPIDIGSDQPHARLRGYLYKVGLTSAIYGLMLLETIRKTPKLDPYPGSDVVLLAELAMLGRFHELKGTRFYRRMHPQASGPANPSLSELAAWFNPSHSGRLVLPAWEHFLGYSAAIGRMPWSLPEKARCYLVLLAWRRFAAKTMLIEALQKAASLVRRKRPG